MGDEGCHGDRGQGAEKGADKGDEGGDASHDTEHQRIWNPHQPEGDACHEANDSTDDQLAAHVRAQHAVDVGRELQRVRPIAVGNESLEKAADGVGILNQEEGHQQDKDGLKDPVDQHEDVLHHGRQVAGQQAWQVSD